VEGNKDEEKRNGKIKRKEMELGRKQGRAMQRKEEIREVKNKVGWKVRKMETEKETRTNKHTKVNQER
jgi:hypothetical protein